jgi:molecular chaperone GrpE
MKEEQKKDENKNNEVEELKKELENAKAKCEEYLNGWKRERADFLNYKKEEMERIGQLVKYANEEIILKIIPILDNICLAARQNFSSENLDGQESPRIKSFFDGLEQIKKQLEDFLAKEGIEAIEVIGKEFDPNLMESVGETPNTQNLPPNTVSEETQRGYTLHGKVIRPAKVKIAK